MRPRDVSPPHHGSKGRHQQAVRRHDPPGASAPVVFDSPHSGTIYPDDFRPAVPLALLQGGEDRFIDQLFRDAPLGGAVLITAMFARTYIDPNRDLTDLDTTLLDEPWPGAVAPSRHVDLGVGLIFRRIADGVPIYNRLLSAAEVQRRIDLYWRPYHYVLQTALDEAYRQYGAVWHVNCHSMQAVGNALSPDCGAVRPDIVLGNLDGRSCGDGFTTLVASLFEDMGYSVAENHPYKGAALVKRHGRPAENRHSLQIEINRRLYMNADDLEKHDGFFRLRADLGRLAAAICEHARQAVARC